uniref:ORF2 n=1 Tax=Torque teno virus TaxID=68887 RepID=Q8UYB9_9VIRU|nr:ORF2 [Torque teno virus]BAB79377.1 ORF2 [Torque teno virus]
MPWSLPRHNIRTREDLWVQSILYSHDTFCGCDNIPEHLTGLLGGVRPAPPRNPGPPTIRSLPALPPAPEPPEEPRRGGDTDGDRGEDGGDAAGAYEPEDLEELFAAAEQDDM